MDIKEMQALKAQMEGKILDALRSFQERTGLTIASVDVDAARKISGGIEIYAVRVDVKL